MKTCREVEVQTLSITILNWNRYNPRNDVKNPSWFRMEHSIFENPDYFDFSHSHLAFWIYVLSIASKKSSGCITLNFRHAQHIGRFTREDIFTALELLEQIGAIETNGRRPEDSLPKSESVTDANVPVTDANVDVTDANVDVTNAGATNETNTTNVTNETNNLVLFEHDSESSKFDFEAIYQNYPRRQNSGSQRKGVGLAILQQRIKTQQSYEQVSMAVKHYREFCLEDDIVGTKFVKQFANFVGKDWKDWIEKPDVSTHKKRNTDNVVDHNMHTYRELEARYDAE